MMFLCVVSLLCLAAINPATNRMATVVLIKALIRANTWGLKPRFTFSVTLSSTVTAKNITIEKIQITRRALRSFFDRVRLIFLLLFENKDQENDSQNGNRKYDGNQFQLSLQGR